jgi:hypothetical protein
MQQVLLIKYPSNPLWKISYRPNNLLVIFSTSADDNIQTLDLWIMSQIIYYSATMS